MLVFYAGRRKPKWNVGSANGKTAITARAVLKSATGVSQDIAFL